MSGSTWGGIGRPPKQETDRRTCEFLHHLADGETLVRAAELAHVKPVRALHLLDQLGFRPVLQVVDDERVEDAA